MKHITIPSDRYAARDFAFVTIALFLLMFAVWILWRHTALALAEGIPPKINANGTIDYTLIDVQAAAGVQTSRTEWAIRLPAEARVDNASDEVNHTMASNTPATVHNQHLAFSVDMNDLSPTFGATSDITATVNLQAQRLASYWPSLQNAQQGTCISTERNLGSLIEYRDADRSKARCSLGNSETSYLYALTRKGNLEATVACLKNGTSCEYEVRYGDRSVTGSFGSAKLARFEDFQAKLKVFLENATVYDR